MVTNFNSRCITVPTGREIRRSSGNNLTANASEITRHRSEIARDHYLILARAQYEESRPSISQETQQSINLLKQTAEES